MTDTEQHGATAGDGEDTAARDRKRRRRRSRLAMAFVLLGALLLPIAGLSFWARNQLLNTDRYVNTIEPLASDPAIQAAAADRLSETVVEVTDLENRAKNALPDQAKFLAAPIAAGAKNLVHDLALQLVQSDQFKTVWREVNRNAHDQIVALLEGRNTASVQREDGKVVLSLGPLAEQLLQKLEGVVPIDLSGIPAERLNIKFVLVDSDDLASAQSGVEFFTKATWVVLFLAVGALVAGALITPDRRRGLQRSALGVVISMGVTLLLYAVLRDRYLNNLPADVRNPAAAKAVFDIVTRNIERGIRVLLLLGLLLLVIAWIPGPSRSAVWLRAKTRLALGRGGDDAPKPEPAAHGPGVPGWVAVHVMELRVLVAGLAIFALAVWNQPSGKTVIWLVVLVLVALGVIQFVASAGRPHQSPRVT